MHFSGFCFCSVHLTPSWRHLMLKRHVHFKQRASWITKPDMQNSLILLCFWSLLCLLSMVHGKQVYQSTVQSWLSSRQQQQQQHTTAKQPSVWTLAVHFFCCLQGLCMGITSSTMIDLRDNLEGDVSMNQLSVAVTFKHIGSIFGALIGGALGDRFATYADLNIALNALAMAIAALLKPFVRYLAVLGIVYFIDGYAQGSLNAGEYCTRQTKPCIMHSLLLLSCILTSQRLSMPSCAETLAGEDAFSSFCPPLHTVVPPQ